MNLRGLLSSQPDFCQVTDSIPVSPYSSFALIQVWRIKPDSATLAFFPDELVCLWRVIYKCCGVSSNLVYKSYGLGKSLYILKRVVYKGFDWSMGQDLNLRPEVLQTPELPDSSTHAWLREKESNFHHRLMRPID